jgi:hypothetical protein
MTTEPGGSATASAAAARPGFPFRLGRWSRVLFLAWGVRPGKAQVRVDRDALDVEFGFFGTRLPIAEIERWELVGPFNWLRAIAVRHTFRTSDISFCTDGRGAIRLWLRSKRHIAWVNADQVYLGVADLDGLAGALSRQGIPGQDLRSR